MEAKGVWSDRLRKDELVFTQEQQTMYPLDKLLTSIIYSNLDF